MNIEVELLKSLPPIFNTLNNLIENCGLYLYLVFVWLALVVIAWIFSAGLRRRLKGNAVTVIPAVIILTEPPRQPEPPVVDIVVEQAWNSDDESAD